MRGFFHRPKTKWDAALRWAAIRLSDRAKITFGFFSLEFEYGTDTVLLEPALTMSTTAPKPVGMRQNGMSLAFKDLLS